MFLYRVEANAELHAYRAWNLHVLIHLCLDKEKRLACTLIPHQRKLEAKLIGFVRHVLRKSESCLGWKQLLINSGGHSKLGT